ncbi:uncharacterized protein LOC133784514 [Humulus lupulus]|uniref:uncharacterized protein LOC133784514 n=1 Tax=Humulus lupulus TaxID=3486 RepID=UPI002B406286|nr:uncharacterized protein LOC133784514 [Humulus lupulus]
MQAIQIGATKVLSMLLMTADFLPPYFSASSFGLDDKQPAFFIVVFATKEFMDVQPGNASDGKLPAIEISSGPVESKSSSLVDAVLCYVVNSDSHINKNILC